MAVSNKAIKTDSSTTTTKKTRSRAESVCEESHWDRLPLEMQEKIMMMAARAVHREQWKQVC